MNEQIQVQHTAQTAEQQYDMFRNVIEWFFVYQFEAGIACIVVIVLAVGGLLYIIYSLRKRIKEMQKNNEHYDGTINGRPVVKSTDIEMPKQNNPDLDGFATGEPFKKSEIGTEKDLDEPALVKPVNNGTANSIINDTVPQPAEKPHPPVIAFTFRQTEKDGKPIKFLADEIKKRIEQTQILAGMVGTAYQCLFDFNIEEVEIMSEPIEMQPRVHKSLKDNGIEILQEGNIIKLTGTPKKPFDGKLYFAFQTVEQLKEKQNKNAEGKTESLYNNFQCTKPFIINAHPKSLWLDLPVRGKDENGKEYDNYDGYENSDNEAKGETIEYVLAVKGTLGTSIGSKPAKTFEVIAASARGRSHAHIAKPRDDAFHFEFDKETGWNYVAVADGAGSAKYSRKGSELATRTVIQKLRETLTKEFNQRSFGDKLTSFQRWKTEFLKANGKIPLETENEFVVSTQLDKVFHLAVDAAYRTIHDEHKKREGSVLKDYHTTLLCAAFRWFPELDRGQGGWFIASYWVGDGGAAILRPIFDGTSTDRAGSNLEANFPKDSVFVLGEPDGGEFAGQTRFLTMPEEITAEKIRSRCRFSFCDSFESIILVTDGITDPFFPSEAAVVDEPRWLEFYEKKLKDGCEEESNGCKEVFSNIAVKQKAEALLKWLGFWSKGNHDDRTILIVRNTEWRVQ